MALTAGSTYFAAVGDVHGHVHAMARMIEDWEERTGNRIAFVLQTGDFEPHRDDADVLTMAAPAKYKRAGDFPEFHAGRAALRWPVYFIGGNHEPYGYLDTMPDGGEVAPNVHYMGRVGSVELEGCCVVGVSGIYSEEHFFSVRPSPAEIGAHSNKDYIYFNEEDIGRALDYSSADIVIVHEWPVGVIDPSHVEEFESQCRGLGHDRIGNEYARMLLDLLAPKLMLCGHMHKAYRNRVELPDGEFAQVCALANVESGEGAVAFFGIGEEGIVEF
jgi:Icc-related predicted phosphoesterase